MFLSLEKKYLKGVNIKNFGAFCFEVHSEVIKPAQHSNFDVNKNLEEQRMERKHVHKIRFFFFSPCSSYYHFFSERPCFIPNQPFTYSLQRYPGKEEISGKIFNDN